MKILVILSVVCIQSVFSQSAAIQKYAPQNQEFTARVYKQFSATSSDSFMISPFSVQTIMALTGAGARGDTAREIQRGLNLAENQTQINNMFSELLPTLKSNKNYQLTTANRIYVSANHSVEESFKKLATTDYYAGAENLNFCQNVQSANTINNWVEERTNHKIKNLISPDKLSCAVALVNVNTLYFNGNWSIQFDPHHTHKHLFYTDNTRSVEVDMMEVTDTFNYYKCGYFKAQFLELPYLGDEVRMVIVLPNSRDGLPALEAQVGDVIRHDKFRRERVRVMLPRFTTETTIGFVEILQKLGIQKAFTGLADFSGIAKSIAISDVIQKTFINVTESGTEAAAATAVFVVVSATMEPPNITTFAADHPFLYYILTKDNVVLFVGRYKKENKC